MDKLICANGHTLGFRRDESRGDGWYTQRCIQCGELAVIEFKCPFCKNNRIFMWVNDADRNTMFLRCTKCAKWISSWDKIKATNKDILKTIPLTALGSILGLGIGTLIAHLGVPDQPATLIGTILALIGAILGNIIGWRKVSR